MNPESNIEEIKVSLRQAVSADARALGQLKYDNLVDRRQKGKIKLSEDLSVEKENNLSDRAVDRLTQSIEQSNDDDYYMVAEARNEIVGMCRMTWQADTNRYQFRQFYVHPRLAGRKIGSKIMREAIRRAQTSHHSPKGMWLEAGDFNTEAHEMYTHFGFRTTGEATTDGPPDFRTWIRMELDF